MVLRKRIASRNGEAPIAPTRAVECALPGIGDADAGWISVEGERGGVVLYRVRRVIGAGVP